MNKRLSLVIIVAVLAVFAFSLALLQPVNSQIEGVSNFNGVHLSQSSFGTATPMLMLSNSGSNRSLEVRNSSATPVWSVDSDGSVNVSGGQTFAGLDMSGIFGLTPTAYTLVGTQTLTPTVTYYEFAPTTVVTVTLAGGSAGDLLIIANTVSTSTTIADTGATVGGGVVTLGENDIGVFIKVDNTWAEVASPDNS